MPVGCGHAVLLPLISEEYGQPVQKVDWIRGQKRSSEDLGYQAQKVES